MTKEHEEMQSWSKSVAEIVADELFRCNIIKKEGFDEAVEVIGEEIFCRLIVGDYPPPPFRWRLLEEKR